MTDDQRRANVAAIAARRRARKNCPECGTKYSKYRNGKNKGKRYCQRCRAEWERERRRLKRVLTLNQAGMRVPDELLEPTVSRTHTRIGRQPGPGTTWDPSLKIARLW